MFLQPIWAELKSDFSLFLETAWYAVQYYSEKNLLKLINHF